MPHEALDKQDKKNDFLQKPARLEAKSPISHPFQSPLITHYRNIGNMAVQRMMEPEGQDPEAPVRLKENSKTGTVNETSVGNEGQGHINDFSNVRIHKDSTSAVSLGALAYTQGNDIHFSPGQYNPFSSEGNKIINHELGHVVQQRQGRVKPTTHINGLPVNDSPSLESEADRLGAGFSGLSPEHKLETPPVQMEKSKKVKRRPQLRLIGSTLDPPPEGQSTKTIQLVIDRNQKIAEGGVIKGAGEGVYLDVYPGTNIPTGKVWKVGSIGKMRSELQFYQMLKENRITTGVVEYYGYEQRGDQIGILLGKVTGSMKFLDMVQKVEVYFLNVKKERQYENAIFTLVIDTAIALRQIHEKDKAHMDIKPGNIGVDWAGRARLFDFGLVMDPATARQTGRFDYGTAFYGDFAIMDPQQFSELSDQDHLELLQMMDVYAFGLTILEWLGHLRPPRDKKLKITLEDTSTSTETGSKESEEPEATAVPIEEKLVKELDLRVWQDRATLQIEFIAGIPPPGARRLKRLYDYVIDHMVCPLLQRHNMERVWLECLKIYTKRDQRYMRRGNRTRRTRRE